MLDTVLSPSPHSFLSSLPVGPKRFKEDIFAKKPKTEKDQEFQTTKKELTVRFSDGSWYVPETPEF